MDDNWFFLEIIVLFEQEWDLQRVKIPFFFYLKKKKKVEINYKFNVLARGSKSLYLSSLDYIISK